MEYGNEGETISLLRFFDFIEDNKDDISQAELYLLQTGSDEDWNRNLCLVRIRDESDEEFQQRKTRAQQKEAHNKEKRRLQYEALKKEFE